MIRACDITEPVMPAPERTRKRSRALGTAQFRRVAENGFGDGSNSYAYSAAWYEGQLYVGSNRDILALLIMRSPFKIPFAFPPVPLPEDYTGLDLRGQIWRYNVERDQWTRVYHAPMIPGFQGRLAPQAFGFRAMTVFQGKSDPKPAIYTIPAVGRNVLESVTLRSLDGEHFETLAAPRVPGINQVFGSFRAMVVFKGRLFVAPSASKGNPEALRVENGKEVHVMHANTSQDSAVLCSDDPVSGQWELSSPPVFGDITNASIIDMCVCGAWLYVGTLNVRHGFQLWRTKAEGPAPHRWELVLDRGADRGAYNQAILCMAEFQGVLYVGTCIQNGGFDRVYQVGPAAGEVLRVYEDGSWDLVMGDPRMTRHGLKTPTSGLRAGFNNALNTYMWRMCVHDGALYVGTCDISSFVPFSSLDTWPDHLKRMLDPASMERFMDRLGGCELWRTTDGDNWLPVTRNGFENRYNLGIRALVSTPHGLFVGTANPFGPQVAVRDGDHWRYEPNPRGGLEMWLGSHDHVVKTPEAPRITLRSQRNGESRNGHSATSVNQDAALEGNYRLLERQIADVELLRNPFLRLASTPPDLIGLTESVEDELAEYFASPARNIGLWPKRSLRPIDACRGLVEDLTARIAEEKPTSLLLVARGADTLANIPRKRLANCQVECLEVGHAPSRRRYASAVLIEACPADRWPEFIEKVASSLAPGATALICDYTAPFGAAWDALVAIAARVGLHVVETRDISANTWVPFFEHSRNYWLVKLLAQQIDSETHSAVLAALPGGNAGVRRYLMVRLKKVEDNSP